MADRFVGHYSDLGRDTCHYGTFNATRFKTRSGSGEKTLLWFRLYPMILVSALFTLIRLFLIVEAFRSLYFLPPSAYIATSSSNIPDIG